MASTLDPVSGLPTDAVDRYLANRTPKTPSFGAGDALSRYLGNVTPAGSPAVPADPLASPAASPTVPGSSIPSVQDLQAMINNDPLYKQTQADIAAARIGDQASLTAARQRALTEYGAVPTLTGNETTLVGNIAPDINDTVRQLAQQNTQAGLSTVGQLKTAYDQNIQALQASLAARGLLSSGETGYQLGQQNNQYQQAGYNALQQLLDTLSGYQSSYLTAEQAREQAIAAAAQAAAGRIPVDTLAATPTSTPAAPASPSSAASDALSQFFRALPSGGFAAPISGPPARGIGTYAS